MIPAEHREFLVAHRLAVVAIGRKERPPALSPVYYVLDGDNILVSTTARRFKGRAVKRRPDVTLCVLGEEFPFPYLTVYGTARIEDGGAAELMARIGQKMFGAPIDAATMPAIEERARQEQRVVLRITPTGFSTRPAS